MLWLDFSKLVAEASQSGEGEDQERDTYDYRKSRHQNWRTFILR